MLRTVLYLILTVLIAHKVKCAGQPKIDKSYIAYGEITQPLKDLENYELQAAFEESYDSNNQNAAFVVWMIGQNVTFIKNFNTNQTFKYTGSECEETTEKEWIQSDYPPGLLGYEDDDGSVRFSLRQLFNLPENFLVKKKQDVPVVYRGVPARMWVYEIAGKDMAKSGIKRKLFIYCYWTDGTWLTSSNEDRVPLAFVIDKSQRSKASVVIDRTVISVFAFASNTYDRKLFEPLEGVICENRSQTLKFPSVQNIRAISLHSEMVFPDYQEIRYIDTWFDPENQLVRVDYERLKDEDRFKKYKKFTTDVAIGKIGVVVRQSMDETGFKCEVIQISEYENDMQNFIDVKQDLKKWRMGKLFGLNSTTYVYTGQTVKSDMPCHLFQGIRKDWPEEATNVTSLWEWCFNVNMTNDNDIVLFLNDEFGLISAHVTILSSGKPDYPEGMRLFHHFYDVIKQDPAILDAVKFDISRCYDDFQKKLLQFYLDWEISETEMEFAENLTSDVTFLQRWKSSLYRNSKLESYSLRIAQVKATIIDKRFYVKFTILSEHRLPMEKISTFEAELNLRDSEKEGKLFISYVIKKGDPPTTLKAVKGSMTQQINPDVIQHTLPPPPPITESTVSTLFPFSLKTDSETESESTDGSTTMASTISTTSTITTTSKVRTATASDKTTTSGSGSTAKSTAKPTASDKTTTSGSGSTAKSTAKPTAKPEKQIQVKKTGHQPGTVAAVSIATLLIGISVGSAGTFYKFFGLPSCMK